MAEESKQDLRDTAKSKGMSDKMTKLVMALRGMGFKEGQSMQGATFGRGNLEAALEWLCMNVPEDQLPRCGCRTLRPPPRSMPHLPAWFPCVVLVDARAVSSTRATSSWM